MTTNPTPAAVRALQRNTHRLDDISVALERKALEFNTTLDDLSVEEMIEAGLTQEEAAVCMWALSECPPSKCESASWMAFTIKAAR